MATADKLNRLKQTKADLKAALIEKGQTPGDVFADYPAKVRAIETGGGGTDVSGVTAGASDVRKGKVFVDSTGAEKEGTQPTRSSADVTLTGGSAAGKIVVEWDGNLEGKDLLAGSEELGIVACKLSVRVFSDDEIKTGNITIADKSGAETHIYAVSPMWDTITSDAERYNADYVMVETPIGYWVFTKNSGLIIYDLPFDEPGVYVLLSLADLITRFETRSGDNTGTSETAIVTVPAGIYDQQVQMEVSAGEQPRLKLL